MKKLILLLFSALFVLSAQAGDVLRLMTYNVRNARGMDNSCNYQRVANVINNARPDVVAVQELDSMTARSNGTDVLRELAERTQLHPYFAPAIDYDGENTESACSRKKLRCACKPLLCRDVKRRGR